MTTAPLNDATDAEALARLRTLPGPETERLLAALDALPTPAARQDQLIAEHRLALTLPALAAWMRDARRECDARRFRDFLADVRRAAERAGAFRDLLADTRLLHQVNVALLAARLFDALVARDTAAIETFAYTLAEVTRSGSREAGGGRRRPEPSVHDAPPSAPSAS